MDLTAAAAPKSDQVNADDLIGGPITVTIAGVRKGSAEQPVNIDLIERPGRCYRPSKSMLRVLIECWGRESEAFVGRRMTLYRNPDIKFGPNVVGGIEISHLSHIDGKRTMALTAKRGQKRSFTVEPLPDVAPVTFTLPDLKTVDELRAHYVERQKSGAGAEELAAIKQAADTLTAEQGAES